VEGLAPPVGRPDACRHPPPPPPPPFFSGPFGPIFNYVNCMTYLGILYAGPTRASDWKAGISRRLRHSRPDGLGSGFGSVLVLLRLGMGFADDAETREVRATALEATAKPEVEAIVEAMS
jgi:hypothetical protein